MGGEGESLRDGPIRDNEVTFNGANVTMLRFDIHLHARPPDANHGAPLTIAGRTVRPLELTSAPTTSFAVEFETAAAQLETLPRLFFEPDGSFVWTGPHLAWQVEGNLYDRAGKLLYITLKGHCFAEQLDKLLTCFGWPDTAVIFQLARLALFLDETEFRRFAEDTPCPR